VSSLCWSKQIASPRWAAAVRPALQPDRVEALTDGGFFFFIFKKIKILKIYVRFGKFQKYTPVALWGGDRAQM
jgi:hypothetical protein